MRGTMCLWATTLFLVAPMACSKDETAKPVDTVTPLEAASSPGASASAPAEAESGQAAAPPSPSASAAPAVEDPARPEFGAELKIPKEFTKVKTVEDGHRVTNLYESPGTARLTMVKAYFTKDEPDLEALWKKTIEPVPGTRIVYKVKKKTWFVASGFIGDTIFYKKVIVSGDRWAQFTMLWDEADRPIYDSLMSPMQKSFRIVDL